MAVTFIYKRIEKFAPEGIKGSALGHSDIFNTHFWKNIKGQKSP